VYILYSRQMHIDAIRAETYDINGKQLDQDADITTEYVVLYRQNCDPDDDNYNKYYGFNANPIMNEWVGQLVTIKLPEDFIMGGDDMDGDRYGNEKKNVLTIPRSVKADDDGVAGTTEELLFTNNGGDNTFELTFFNEDVYDKIPNEDYYLGVCGLGGLWQETLEYHTPMNYFEYLAGEEVDPDEVDKADLTDLIDEANGLDEADYENDAAWAALPAAIAAAQAVADDEDATQDEVDQAVLDLQDAIDALVPIAAPTVEFTAVKYSLNAEYTVTSTSVPGATRYSIITVAGGVETESDIKDIGEILSGAINATITIKVYDGSDVLLHTFEDVPTGLTP
ncbi:MAG TPA: hypothetical protein VFC79_13495, partial [Tissierellaceae bacterium]|nr:hypothetical protein [Tissierellaceae bacterium]